AKLGRPIDGLTCLDEAAQIVDSGEQRTFEANLYLLKGDLLNDAGDRAADQSYRQAITVAQRQSARLFELRATTNLAQMWRDQGKRGEARDLLAPVYNWFTEGFDMPVLKEAKALLLDLQ